MSSEATLSGLPDNPFWRWFLQICAIPHPSGHEEKLRDFLADAARRAGLKVRHDAAGNLAIDRPAAPGRENAPKILLQGHLDMVPQAADGVAFDFASDPVRPVVEDGWVTTGGRTTLGADDGVALAGAMELLLDPALRCGALGAVFTAGEETGLNGAAGIDPDFLRGDWLFNLDSGEGFTIGCAGGARLEGVLTPETAPPPSGAVGVEIAVRNLAGGHSGEDIHRMVGNANAVLIDFLRRFPALAPAEIRGGTVDNAIPREAHLTGAIPGEEFRALAEYAAARAEELNRTLEHDPAVPIVAAATPCALPAAVWAPEARRALTELLGKLPCGLLARTPDGASATSANLAILSGRAGGEFRVVMHLRSISNGERRKLSDALLRAMREAGLAAAVVSEYSGWAPRPDSELVRHARLVHREITGKEAELHVIHGGLEPGIFSGINPALQMISFAPLHDHLHSPRERLNIASVQLFRELLRALVVRAEPSGTAPAHP